MMRQMNTDAADASDDFDTIDHRLVALVERLVELTVASKMSWEYVSGEEAFAHSLNGVSIQVYARDGDGRSPYVFELKNSADVIIEKFLTSEPQGPVQQVLAGKIASLYTVARREALQVGAVLDTLIGSLSGTAWTGGFADDEPRGVTDDARGPLAIDSSE
jgi:hypothetical protein